MSHYLCVIGSSNLDHVVSVTDFPKPGQTITAENYQLVYGGKGANQAVAAVKSGGNVHFVSRLGNDAEGQKMRTHFAELGMNVDAVTATNEQPTGQAIIQVNQNGENAIAVVAGANQCLNEQAIGVEANHIQQADLVLIQLETDFSGIKKAIDIATQADKKIILNPAPAQTLSDDILSKLWLITPNETETEQLTGIAVTDSESAKIAAQALLNKGVQQVIITMGKNGVYYHSQSRSELHQGFSVKAVDTTAAGDTFNGALATALLNGKKISEAIRFAQAAAALSVQKSGAQPSIPSYDDIVSFLEKEAVVHLERN